jgi:transcriptional regulator with XRE-family HTH domain
MTQPGSLALRLRELREAAGLTGEQLGGEKLGWRNARTKVSRVETGKQLLTEDEVTAWAEATGHPEAAAGLLDLLASSKVSHTRWSKRLEAGQASLQRSFTERIQTATRIRSAELVLIPGELQTPGYIRSIVMQVAAVYGPRDIEATVQERVRRREVLDNQSAQFEFVLTEACLRLFPCPREAMADQLRHLLREMERPNVTVGVLPFGQLQLMPFSSFLMLDEETFTETWTGRDTEIDQINARIFSTLMGQALTGDDARRLISATAEALR